MSWGCNGRFVNKWRADSSANYDVWSDEILVEKVIQVFEGIDVSVTVNGIIKIATVWLSQGSEQENLQEGPWKKEGL